MALVENNASVAAEIAMNLAEKCSQSSLNNNAFKCTLAAERNPVNKTKIFVYPKKYIILFTLFSHSVICLCYRL